MASPYGPQPDQIDEYRRRQMLAAQMGDGAPRSAPGGEQGVPGGPPVQMPEAVVGGGAGVQVRQDIPQQPMAVGGGPQASWNTDKYAAPQYTPPKVGNILQGYDAGNWNNPNMQTPKYAIGRILSNYGVNQIDQALADIQKAYPGATFNGKDILSIPGVGDTDIIQNAGADNAAWQWLTPGEGGVGGGGGHRAGSASPLSGSIAGLAAALGGDDVFARILAEIDALGGGRGSQLERNALLSQLNVGA